MRYLHVSAYGDRNGDGSEKKPFSNIADAQLEARKYPGDNIIYLHGGYYFLESTLCFDERDSGITIKNYNNETPVISGGKIIENWEAVSDNIWRAYIENPGIVRELYIDGIRASRASSKRRIKPLGWYNDLSKPRTEAGGIFIKNSDAENLENETELQLHYCRGWRSMVVNADRVIPYDNEKSIILCSHKSFSQARNGWHKISQDTPFILENAMCFLDVENDFYYDTKTKYLYCCSNSDMNEKICIIPVLETVIQICGSNLASKVRGITIEGITISHAAWYRPHIHGLITGQANVIDAVDTKAHETLDNSFVPAGIKISAAEDIDFRNNVFSGFGAVAVGMYEGVKHCNLEQNVFFDIGDSAVTVGLPHHNYEEKRHEGRNYAIGKRAYASEEYGGNEAKRTNCGDLKIGWFTDMPYPWWEVDLGKDTDFNRIEILSRLDADLADSRKNFSVLAATEKSPKRYDVLYSIGEDESFGYKSTLRIDFDRPKRYRYIRVRRDIQQYFFINEVRVINTKEEYIPYKEVCRDNRIADNIITKTGLYQWGAPAITAYYTSGLDITHNTIFDVPYSGISVGWGWSNYTDSDTCRNNSITYNEVYDDVQICFDGGTIYTLGNQFGSVIKGNYFHDHPNYPGAIYMDEGTEGYTITENVVENCDVPFFIHLETSKHINVYNNYFTSPNYSNQGDRCRAWNNKLFIPGHYDKIIADIVHNAGARNKELWNKIPKYEPIREKDKFYNVINEMTSVPEPVFVTQYLKKTIYTIESMAELVEGDQKEQLKKLIKQAYDFLEKSYRDRSHAIDFRLYMKEQANLILGVKEDE